MSLCFRSAISDSLEVDGAEHIVIAHVFLVGSEARAATKRPALEHHPVMTQDWIRKLLKRGLYVSRRCREAPISCESQER